MTPLDHAYNAGVRAVLDVARRSADAIAARGHRPIAEGFAVEALAELAIAGELLLIADQPDAMGHAAPAPDQPKAGPAGAMIEAVA